MPQRIYKKMKKQIPGWSYWGEEGDIEIGISCGVIGSQQNSVDEKLHYHRKGVVFILGLEGKGKIEVDSQVFELNKDEVLRIGPEEKYRHLENDTQFSWITVCTVKDKSDKVAIE